MKSVLESATTRKDCSARCMVAVLPALSSGTSAGRAIMDANSVETVVWGVLALLGSGGVLFFIVLACEEAGWSRGQQIRHGAGPDRASEDVQSQAGSIPRSRSCSLMPDWRVYAVLRSAGKPQRLSVVPRPPVVDWLLAGVAPLPHSEPARLPLPPSRRLTPSPPADPLDAPHDRYVHPRLVLSTEHTYHPSGLPDKASPHTPTPATR